MIVCEIFSSKEFVKISEIRVNLSIIFANSKKAP